LRNSLSCFLFAALIGLACRSRPPGVGSAPGTGTAGLDGPGGRPTATVARVSPGGGRWQMYRLPVLTPLPSPSGALPRSDRIIGLDPEAEALYVMTLRDDVLAGDLLTARIDTVGRQAAQAVLGPEGTLYVVDDEHRVIALKRRARRQWPTPLPTAPAMLFGAADQLLLAVVRGDPPRLLAASAEQAADPVTLPGDSAVAATYWGDLVAVATDSGVVLLDPLGRRRPGFLRLRGKPGAVAFSPSGHRLYVTRAGRPGLAAIDRFRRRALDDVSLPGPAAALRLDPLGRFALARQAAVADSVWIVDLSTGTLRGTIATPWEADLPAIAPDGTLLFRTGDAVVAVAADSPQVVLGRVAGGARDRWMASRWHPRGLPTQAAGSPSGADSVGSEGPLYVQVSVSQNRDWSAETAQQLVRAGLPARVLPPRTLDDGYRVVLGPYPTRGEAEAIGRKLGRPFWIYQAGGGR
jgi:hypothetical protein